MSAPFSVEDLESLAVWLDRTADVAEAKAKQHVANSEKKPAELQVARRDKAAHYAWTCREAASRLRTREKRGSFVPPTLREVKEFGAPLGWPASDMEAWHDHFSSNGWKISGKTIMLDWRAAARNGYRRWKKENALNPAARKPGEDPDRWRTWLKIRSLPYQTHHTALAHVRDEFNKWLAANP